MLRECQIHTDNQHVLFCMHLSFESMLKGAYHHTNTCRYKFDKKPKPCLVSVMSGANHYLDTNKLAALKNKRNIVVGFHLMIGRIY